MQRIPVLARDELDQAQREAYDAIASGPRGVVQGPLNVWLHSADLAQHAQALGAFCRYGTTLPPRLSELAILVTAVHWQAGFEWYAHAKLGLKAGLDPAQVEVLRTGGTPDFAAEDERLVYALASELLRTRDISEATYARGEAVLGRRGLVELIGILGYYQLISMTIKTFRVALPAGEPDPFPAR
jgi:4-carboxymuconolactone decarboxylase